MSKEEFKRGACRILYRRMGHSVARNFQPKTYKDVIDPKTFEAIYHWKDIGASKTGFVYDDKSISTSLAEITLERLKVVSPGSSVELAILWQNPIDKEIIEMKYWPFVTKARSDSIELSAWNECVSLPVKFLIEQP